MEKGLFKSNALECNEEHESRILVAAAEGWGKEDLELLVEAGANVNDDYKITVGPCKAKPSQKPNTYPANKKNNKDSGGGSKRGGKGKKTLIY